MPRRMPPAGACASCSEFTLPHGLDARGHPVPIFGGQWRVGPLSCPSYDAGSRRRVPGRKGATWTEDDWVDEDATSHWGRDE